MRYFFKNGIFTANVGDKVVRSKYKSNGKIVKINSHQNNTAIKVRWQNGEFSILKPLELILESINEESKKEAEKNG